MMQVQQGSNNNNNSTTAETNNSSGGGSKTTADEVRNSGDDETSGKQRLSSSATAIGDLVIDESGDEDDVTGVMTSSPSQKENKTPQNCKSGGAATTNISNGAGLKLETVNKNFKISDAR